MFFVYCEPMATTSDHNFLVRVLSEDGEILHEDADFSEDARHDWFDEVLRWADDGEVVQLIDTSDDSVIIEKKRKFGSV